MATDRFHASCRRVDGKAQFGADAIGAHTNTGLRIYDPAALTRRRNADAGEYLGAWALDRGLMLHEFLARVNIHAGVSIRYGRRSIISLSLSGRDGPKRPVIQLWYFTTP